MIRIAIIIIIIICLFQGQLHGFLTVPPISPYIGSIPALANARTYEQTLQKIIGPKTNYSNGFFWPPPGALVAQVLEKDLLQSSGLAGLINPRESLLANLGLGNLGLGGLSLPNIASLGLLRNPQGFGYGGNIQIIQIPLTPQSSSTCQVPCFPCSSQTPLRSIFLS
uniref:Uncharacterized protein n=1 Tax=Setaria digitata TaxID=48799 RepID=A0A915PRF7_9BILA